MHRLLAAALLLLLGAAGPADGAADHIVIDKSARTLTLRGGRHVLLTIRHIRLGAAPIGHKRFEGDERTPEGRYAISERKADSRYHLALRISYPDARDRKRAARIGRSPGGDIMIHGQPFYSPLARIGWDWTDGCIAVSNAEMNAIWRLVPLGTRVTIRP